MKNNSKHFKKHFKKHFSKILIIAAVVAIIISFLFSIGIYSNIELKLRDNLYGGVTPLDSIIIIAIDDKSIQEIGRWPWDREVFANILPELFESRVIGIDVAFFEPQSKTQDETLAQAIKKANNVILPVEYSSFTTSETTTKTVTKTTVNSKIIGKNPLKPIPLLVNASRGLGYINTITDRDGVSRAVNLNIQGDYNNSYNSFAYEIYRNFWSVPVDEQIKKSENRFLVSFVDQENNFKKYSFSDVLNKKISKSEFKNRIVLVGATSPSLQDDIIIPNSENPMPGVELHANIIQTLITQRFLVQVPSWFVIIYIFLTAIIIALLFYFLPVWLSALLGVLSFVAHFFITIYLFSFGIIFNILFIPATIVSSYLVLSVYSYISEKTQRKQAVGALEKYVSKDVIKHILENPDRLKLGGERKNITVFFSDLRGFTSLSEKLNPEKLVLLLNEYFSCMTNIILKNNGVVDKYIGDAIMAFWGAPIYQPRHAELACKTALEMKSELAHLQKKWLRKNLNLDIGIGLNSGQAVIGNMGSQSRFDYTAIGDTVNLGSRLEGITKHYGVMIIISELTKKLVETDFYARKLDAVRVKGKNKPVDIYELVAAKESITPAQKQAITHFEKGLQFYLKQEWHMAVSEFNTALHHAPDDKPAKIFIERCNFFEHNSPKPDWDGVWTMTTK